ncbi:murein biosynthesis integral membrane protein MurJ [Flagellimonas okinawensis]|uniref:Lipid II flippase MurJ n=1 Tax=Flagellimonas okinawensis TaxID=3031324 RepID=A0ABT5XR10_9FLAO|nr:lipid II flippase MurJ [[Muricauda] okinawensis]MDF0708337.1 lipid II flippase MurJ [[Muricauda] okinawensis]
MSIKSIISKLTGRFKIAIVRNIIIVGSVTLFVKVAGFYKETLVASSFGLSELLDSFYLAILIPSFIQAVFIGSVKNIFIPNYVAETKNSENPDIGGFQTLGFLLIFGIVLIFIILTFLFGLYFLEYAFPNHTDSFYSLTRTQLFIMTPCLLFWGGSSLLSALLDIDNKFLASAIYPVFIAVCTIIFLVYFKESFGEMVLALGTLTGSVVGFIFLLAVTLKSKLIILSNPLVNENTRMMINQLPPKITSGFLTGMNQFVDQFFAAQLAVGSISAINYGIKIPSFILTLSMIATGTVLLPYFSKKITENRLQAFKDLFKILKVIFGLGLVVTAVIFIFSSDIIRFLFERNEFTSDDTYTVSLIQQIILVYVPFYLCGNLLGKFLTSINKNRFMAWVSLYNLIANIAFNIIFMKLYGVYGLAISTSLVITISSFIYLFFTYKQYKRTLAQ